MHDRVIAYLYLAVIKVVVILNVLQPLPITLLNATLGFAINLDMLFHDPGGGGNGDAVVVVLFRRFSLVSSVDAAPPVSPYGHLFPDWRLSQARMVNVVAAAVAGAANSRMQLWGSVDSYRTNCPSAFSLQVLWGTSRRAARPALLAWHVRVIASCHARLRRSWWFVTLTDFELIKTGQNGRSVVSD
ncbi:hypothetical protein IV203_019939 [Nitzschia inconspicua]|uniref:Uncharacterized protein n=1 Tax=Nitzschia inconspicua TaxID=303405 RepID=A0A9K3Q7T8_9STRA|nr:hypothetical protein IV203_019939 [Nitzschia inconspicua]